MSSADNLLDTNKAASSEASKSLSFNRDAALNSKDQSDTRIASANLNKDDLRQGLQVQNKERINSEISHSRGNTLEDLRKEGAVTPQSLQQLYLSGKIALDQLTHELKVYNSVSADTYIRSGKGASVQAVNFKEVKLADYGDNKKSNQDLNGKTIDESQEQTKAKATSVHGAKMQARDSGSDKQKHEAEKQIKNLRRQEEQKQTTIKTNIFTQSDKDKRIAERNADYTRKAKEKEEEKKDQDRQDPNASLLEKLVNKVSPKFILKRLLSRGTINKNELASKSSNGQNSTLSKMLSVFKGTNLSGDKDKRKKEDSHNFKPDKEDSD